MPSLEPGRRLGPYEIMALAGAGGMGKVHRAKDTRLERAVAVETLSMHLAHNPGLRERFEPETRAVSGLSHPHIRTLYGIGREVTGELGKGGRGEIRRSRDKKLGHGITVEMLPKRGTNFDVEALRHALQTKPAAPPVLDKRDRP